MKLYTYIATTKDGKYLGQAGEIYSDPSLCATAAERDKAELESGILAIQGVVLKKLVFEYNESDL